MTLTRFKGTCRHCGHDHDADMRIFDAARSEIRQPEPCKHGTRWPHECGECEQELASRLRADKGEPTKVLAAFTATTYPGNYPPYINVRQVGSMLHIAVRGTCPENGEMGGHALAVVNVWTASEMAKALAEAVRDFEPGFGEDPRSIA